MLIQMMMFTDETAAGGRWLERLDQEIKMKVAKEAWEQGLKGRCEHLAAFSLPSDHSPTTSSSTDNVYLFYRVVGAMRLEEGEEAVR